MTTLLQLDCDTISSEKETTGVGQLAPPVAVALPKALVLISAPIHNELTGAGQVIRGAVLQVATQLTVTVNTHVAVLLQPSVAV